MKNKFLLILIFPLLALASCVKADDVRVVDMADLNFHSLSRMDLLMIMDNRSGKDIHIKDMDVSLFTAGGSKLLQLQLRDEVVIPKRMQSNVLFPLRMKIDNPFALISATANIMSATVSGHITVKAGMAKKTFRFQDVDLARVERSIGVENIQNLITM